MHGLRGIQRLPVNRWPREFLPPLYPTSQNNPNNPTEDNRVTKEKSPVSQKTISCMILK